MNTLAKQTAVALIFMTSCCVGVATASGGDLLGQRAAGWENSNRPIQPGNNVARRPAVQNPVVQQPIVRQPVIRQPVLTQPWQPGAGLYMRQTHVTTIEFLVTDPAGRTTTFQRNYTTEVRDPATGQYVSQPWKNELRNHISWMQGRGHVVTPSIVRRDTPTVVVGRAPTN